MPALYLPVIVMLLALVFRGVAFEFRESWRTARRSGMRRSPAARRSPASAQGVILGGLIQGIRVENGAYAGGTFDWATPFALLCGFGVIVRLCAARRHLAGDEDRGRRSPSARAHRPRCCFSRCSAFMAAVSLWTPLAFPRIAERWFSLPNFFYLWPVPLVTALTAFVGWRGVATWSARRAPFVATIALFLLGYLGLVISGFPYLVPPSLTIWQTAAAPASQIFMLIGTLVLLPLILAYTALRLLAVPRQGQPGRELSLSLRRAPARAAGSCPSRRASAACGPGSAVEKRAAPRPPDRETAA